MYYRSASRLYSVVRVIEACVGESLDEKGSGGGNASKRYTRSPKAIEWFATRRSRLVTLNPLDDNLPRIRLPTEQPSDSVAVPWNSSVMKVHASSASAACVRKIH